MSATEYYKGIIIMSKRKSFYGGQKSEQTRDTGYKQVLTLQVALAYYERSADINLFHFAYIRVCMKNAANTF